MKPAAFTYSRPSSVEEASSLLAEHGDDAELLAGGQSLIPMMNFRRKQPEKLIDLNNLDELAYIRRENGVLHIGAMTRQATVGASETVTEGCPLVQEALSYVGHKPTRHRGTIGGNLANADPLSELPAVVLAMESDLVLRNETDSRVVSATDYFQGGMETAIADDELLTEVRIPVQRPGAGYHFTEQRPRDHGWSVAGLATVLQFDGGEVSTCRLAYMGIADRPVRLHQVEERVVGTQLTEAVIEEAGAVARDVADPPSREDASPDDLKNNQRTGPTPVPHASQYAPKAFREQLVETFTRRGLTRARERAEVS